MAGGECVQKSCRQGNVLIWFLDLRLLPSAARMDVKVAPLPEDASVYVITLAGKGEHRYNEESLAAINRALDDVEKDANAAALVISNEGKFFSNGLDLAAVGDNPGRFQLIVADFHKLLKRLLLFPIPTVAAICGHAAAAGCMFALAMDYRVMSADRGYIFLSEIDIRIPLTAGMNAVIRSKIPGNNFYKAVLSAHKYSAKTAVGAGFVDAALPDPASTLKEALDRAKALAARNFDRLIYNALKGEMFKQVIKDLEDGGFGPIPAEVLLSRM
ncbi:hypothetical protein R1flu_001871 [Riccia fluitans]|uniref:Delta(3)-Delta(2)-enoyl-CoA isomerase n=1 Tax=Riccia fluitans TaxID=41844 RepID=A0ABD1Y4I0_9MARC